MKNWMLAAALLLVAALAWSSVASRSRESLIVYCAHDLVFAQSILDEFTRRTGIPIAVVGDTEATKSLGLVQRLLIEKHHPRCDVFWNNQLLGTMQLAEAGILEPYQGAGYARLPEQYKDPSGRWVGFAGRLRVWIVNTTKMPATAEAVEQLMQSSDLSRMAIARPLFGTTLSQFSILWQTWGPERLQEWHRSLQKRGCQIMSGNGPVKNLVAEGICDAGWTDTDDFFVGRDDGFPVAQLPIRIDGNKTICLPNSVAIIHGTRKLTAAQKLVDYLLSAEVELALARSASRQIPLGPVDRAELPEDVQPLMDWARESIDVREFYPARRPCLEWLKQEYAQ